jgi:hypothetical protein
MIHTSASGTFSDGSGAANYLNGANCVWMIAPSDVPPATDDYTRRDPSLITITFTEFSTLSAEDFVRVFACATIDCGVQEQLAELSGTYAMQPVFSTSTGFMKVVFTSDFSATSPGFTASWNSVSMNLLPLLYSKFSKNMLEPS